MKVKRGGDRLNLQNLRVFHKVAELEHITHAAEALGLSQPAVTKIIQSLEHEVGLELIERQGRRIALTHAGHTLHQYTRRLFALEREMEDTLATLRDIEGGEVILAANTTTGIYLLPPIVARFRARYPHVNLRISILNSHEIIEGTLNWQLDFGLVEGDPSALSPELKVSTFAYDHLILVAAPTHPWSRYTSLKPEMLSYEELVMREEGSSVREAIEQVLARYSVPISPLFILTNNEAIKQMVMNGVGAAIVSALSVRRELESGDLVYVPIEGLELRPQLSLIQRVDKHLSRAAQAFCAYLDPQVIERTLPSPITHLSASTER
jgi:DNA-binding transcriptional LysR family regulator